MKFRFIVLAALFLLSGCTSVEFVRKDFTPKKQATLRYPSQSSRSDDLKFREKISSEARNFCDGDYTITKEYQARDEGNSSVGVGTGFGLGTGSVFMGTSDRGSSMYNFAEVSCKN